MHEIQSNLLWIGHALDVREPQGLFDMGISAIVDVAYDEPTAKLPRQLTSFTVTVPVFLSLGAVGSH